MRNMNTNVKNHRPGISNARKSDNVIVGNWRYYKNG